MPRVALPFTDADFVGPDDRPSPAWEIAMYQWQAFGNVTVKEWLDEMAGASVRAVQVAPKPEAGLLYVRACDPHASKAHSVSVSPTQRSASFSLYTPLLAMDFPRISTNQRAVFKCWPETYGDQKVLVIRVRGYRVERTDREYGHAAASVQSVGDPVGPDQV